MLKSFNNLQWFETYIVSLSLLLSPSFPPYLSSFSPFSLLSFSLSLSVVIFPFVSISLSLVLFLSISLSLTSFFPFSLCLSSFFPFSFSLSSFFPFSNSLSHPFPLSLSLSLCLSHVLFIILFLSRPFFSLSLSLSLSHVLFLFFSFTSFSPSSKSLSFSLCVLNSEFLRTQ